MPLDGIIGELAINGRVERDHARNTLDYRVGTCGRSARLKPRDDAARFTGAATRAEPIGELVDGEAGGRAAEPQVLGRLQGTERRGRLGRAEVG
ncbi:hypothetical protein EV292_106191 [Sphingomonas sp. BK235]|nr:hypothetical protein EV292_106191 [Sphingomonas sp. BK235]